MDLNQSVLLLLIASVVLANIPFVMGNRLFLFIKVPHKSIVVNFVEWAVYLIVMGLFAYLLENKSMGHVASQGWEFYTVNIFMFLIFAFPGFIYRYNLKQFLNKNKA